MNGGVRSDEWDGGAFLARCHRLLLDRVVLSLRIGQNVNTLWNNPIQVCIAYFNRSRAWDRILIFLLYIISPNLALYSFSKEP